MAQKTRQRRRRNLSSDILADILALFDGAFSSIELNSELVHFARICGCAVPAPETVGRRLAQLGCECVGRRTVGGKKVRVYQRAAHTFAMAA